MPVLVGTIESVYRHPVKSAAGESPPRLDISPTGVSGDRRIVVVNQATGRAVTAKPKKAEPLLGLQTSTVVDDVHVSLDGSAWLPWHSSAAASLVSQLLGFDVFLQDRAGSRVALTTNTGFDLLPGVGVDSSPVGILTTAILETAGNCLCLPGQWRPERFRPNLYIKTRANQGPRPEFDWVGGTLVFPSGLMLAVTEATARCALVTQAQLTLGLDADHGILRVIKRYFDGNLGAYATPISPGTAQPGDEVLYVPPGEPIPA